MFRIIRVIGVIRIISRMLPKASRLTKKKDFETVFKNSKSAREGFLMGKAMDNHLQVSRFGFVVSKKVSSKATVRNKVKRRLRKAVLDNMGQLQHFLDVVIVALPGIEKKEFSEVKKTTAGLFRKMGVI